MGASPITNRQYAPLSPDGSRFLREVHSGAPRIVGRLDQVHQLMHEDVFQAL